MGGTLTWGYGPFTATEDFGNGTKCLSKGKAKKCTLAPVGNELRTMPPSTSPRWYPTPAATLRTIPPPSSGPRAHARGGENAFIHLNCYQGDNTLLRDASCTAGATYPYFCCMPLGGL